MLTDKNFDKYRAPTKSYEIYSDFMTSFIPHPNTGQIVRRTDIDSIKQALRNLIFTNKYERLRNPRFGTNLRRFLFEPFISTTMPEIRDHIKEAIKKYEPRVRVIDVIVDGNPDQNEINVSITFYAIVQEQQEKLNLTLYRVR